ncbi:hypothetical protein BKA69DRAFT_1051326 [Paraphysoderma sedebokerense]|nr:hypothetical protein BKA69DRAFT_1051287 [Paraphysoderma sedebokerense]KAI9145410.1 hypothetical protein BKA69DRAFT_1051326 [Paraphysoderma sedebokerense]
MDVFRRRAYTILSDTVELQEISNLRDEDIHHDNETDRPNDILRHRPKKSIVLCLVSFVLTIFILFILSFFVVGTKNSSLALTLHDLKSYHQLPEPVDTQMISFERKAGYGIEFIHDSKLNGKKLKMVVTDSQSTGGIELIDIDLSDEKNSVTDVSKKRIGRTKLFTQLSVSVLNGDNKFESVDLVIAYSSLQHRLHMFKVTGGELVPVLNERPKLDEGDAGALCGGRDKNGENVVGYFMKDGRLSIYIVRTVKKVSGSENGTTFEFVKYATPNITLYHVADSITDCKLDSTAAMSFIITTHHGHFYKLSIPLPTADPIITRIFSTSTLLDSTTLSSHSKVHSSSVKGKSIPSFIALLEQTTSSVIVLFKIGGKGELASIYHDRSTNSWKYLTGVSLPGLKGKTYTLNVFFPHQNTTRFGGGVLSIVTKTKTRHIQEIRLYDLNHILPFSISLNLTTLSAPSFPPNFENTGTDILNPYNCQSETNEVKNCSRNGYCKDSVCHCFGGFYGDTCQNYECKAMSNCRGNDGKGECVGPNICRCTPPYTGESCSHILVPADDALVPSFLSNFSANDNDDAAVYRHPSDPNYSVFIGSTKARDGGNGIHIWNADGEEIWFESGGVGNGVNSVDVLYGVPIQDSNETIDVVVAGVRGHMNAIGVWQIHPNAIIQNSALPKNSSVSSYAPIITPIASPIDFDDKSISIYGSCIYSPHSSSKKYIIVTTKKGELFQFELRIRKENDILRPELNQSRNFTIGLKSQLENCVADSVNEILYVGEESVGVWAYGANSGDPSTVMTLSPLPVRSKYLPTLIDTTVHIKPSGHLTRDVEGLAMYSSPNNNRLGYIIVSAQGSNSINIYNRVHPWEFLASIRIGGFINTTSGEYIDEVTATDSLAAFAGQIGKYKEGALVLHDDCNTGQNIKDVELEPKTAETFENAVDNNGEVIKAKEYNSFKVVSWRSIVEAVKNATNNRVVLQSW